MGPPTLGNALVAGMVSVAITSCSSWDSLTGSASGPGGADPTESTSAAADGTGSVGIHLDLAPGTTLIAVQWTISNGTNTYLGVVEIGDSQSLEFVRGGIAVGDGYTVQLAAADNQGDTCTGTSPSFSIAAGAVTQTTLALTCQATPDGSNPFDISTGTAEIDASITLATGAPVSCPGISSFSISPAAISANQTATLTLSTVGPTPTITWSVSPAAGGTFGNPHVAATTFVCATGGALVPQVSVIATVGLPDSGICAGEKFTTMSALVNCLGPAGG